MVILSFEKKYFNFYIYILIGINKYSKYFINHVKKNILQILKKYLNKIDFL